LTVALALGISAYCVASLNRQEENITGITWFGGDLAGKRLVRWHALSVDTHKTEGSFTFRVGEP
jgi:methionine-rich copper-binding protein CopC